MADIDTARAKKPRRPRRARDEGDADSPDPIEIAMKAVATGADRHGAARAVLEKHACLIDIQCQREREEWHVLRVQRLTRWLLLLAVAGIIAGMTASVWNASRSRSLIIEPFSVPPALEQRGLTGKVIGARLLDKLSEFQRTTESSRAQGSYANNWEDEVQVDIPQTGISVGEAWRTLRRWLGQETRIGGEVVQAAPGTIAITTRAGGLSGGTHEGSESEMDALVAKAAESIYRATQPYRYAIYLGDNGRAEERLAVLTALSGDSEQVERMWALNGLSVDYRELGQDERALAFARAALEIDPDFMPALANVGSASLGLGHDEMALRYYRLSNAAHERAGPDDYDPRIALANYLYRKQTVALRLGDAAAAKAEGRALARQSTRSFAAQDMAYIVPAALLAHDYGAAATALRQARPNAQLSPWDLQAAMASTLLARAIDYDDGAAAERAARRLLRAADAEIERPAGLATRGAAEVSRRNFAWPGAATGLAVAGRYAEAEALVARTAPDCYECVRARGRIAMARRDRAGAERWLREAVRQGPSIPMAYKDLGQLHLAGGDLDGAIEHFELAHRKGPGWPDPLKLWGEALARQGRDAEAIGKYRASAERAPRWGALHIEWGKALWRSGKRDEARTKFRAASGMDLSEGDRARLRRIRAVAARRG